MFDETTRSSLLKIRKGASLDSAKKIETALAALGARVETTKEGRRVISRTVTFPADAPVRTITVGGNHPEAMCQPYLWDIYGSGDNGIFGSDPRDEDNFYELPEAERSVLMENYKVTQTTIQDTIKEMNYWIRGKASELLGLEHPMDRDGLPPRARDARTDFTIRTCPCCFRDIKATRGVDGRSSGSLIADHGFTIEGRDWSSFGGTRQGGCAGVGCVPWDRSSEATRERLLKPLERFYTTQQDYLNRLKSGDVTHLSARARNPKTRQYEDVNRTPADGYKWEKALKGALLQTERTLKNLRDRNFGSIPYVRAAIRLWTSHPDDESTCGAPVVRFVDFVDTDFEGL